MEQECLLRLEQVELCQEEHVILRNASLMLREGEFVYVIGRVGSGKSSLLKSLYGEALITDGHATVMGYDLRMLKPHQLPFLRRRMGIVFQDFQLLTDRSVYHNLEFVLKATGWKKRQAIKNRIAEILEQIGLPNKGYKMPHELSGGEQQRIAIGRSLLNDPPLILADEPTGNLDPETGSQIVQLLHDICRRGKAVIMSTHNYSIVQRFPARVVQCADSTLTDLGIRTVTDEDEEA